MPFHRFYVPRDLYTTEEKHAIAEAITQLYTPLPKFYVVVNFINIEDGDFYVGGEKNNKFVRIVVHHAAHHEEEYVVVLSIESLLLIRPTVLCGSELLWISTRRRSRLGLRAKDWIGKSKSVTPT